MKFHRFLMLLCLSLIVAACGGGGGGSSSSSASYGPTASAGTDRTVAMGDTVTLDGSASKAGSSNGALTYTWTLVSKPASSNAGLSSATAVNPSFVADVAGSYTVRLVVNDGSLGSEAVTVTITATSTEPVAVAATEQNVLIGAAVTLDGSSSVPPTGGAVSSLLYQWTLTGIPTGSSATLGNASAARATLYADVAGVYTATLVVSYGSKVSSPLTVTVTAKASNSIPTAVAKVKAVGGNAVSPTNSAAPYQYAVERGQAVTLDASSSVDGDNDALSYRWYFFSPGASTAGNIPTCSKLSRAMVMTGPNPSFTPDAAGSWTVYMTAFDGTSVSSTTSIGLTVTKPASASNTSPEAVFLTTGDSYEVELGTTVYRSGNSCDIDGDTLTRSYQWVSTPAGWVQPDLSTATSLAFTPTVAGNYVVNLTVVDGKGGSSTTQGTFVARTGANVRPTPAVTVDSATLLVGSTAWFDGSNSTDSNGDQLSYSWTLIDRPDGSSASLQNASSVRASLVPDVAGTYIARLQVTDSLGATGLAISIYHGKVNAKSRNNAPTVDGMRAYYNPMYIAFWGGATSATSTLGTDEQPFIAGNPMLFNPLSVVDPDNDALYYLWTLAQPQGSSLTDAATTRAFTMTPQVAGSYTGTLVVSDGVARSATQNIGIKVVNEADYPTVLLKAHGLSISSSTGQPLYATPVAWPYSLTDGTYVTSIYYSLTAYGGDYTIANLATTSATSGVLAPTFSGLQDGQVIRRGESVLFSLVPPTGLLTTQSRDILWTFGIKEKPGYVFSYRVQK